MVDQNKTELQQQLIQLRQEYAVELPSRVHEIVAAWRVLDGQTRDESAWMQLRHLVHRLAGSAATFGFPKLSKKARELESQIVAQQRLTDSDEDIALHRLGVLVNALVDELGLAQPEAFKAKKQSVLEQGRSKNRLIYLVEDDTYLANELTLQLQRFGFDVKHFGSATAVVGEIGLQAPDIILMDMMLPEGELAGAETIQALREHSDIGFPVMFMSVRNDFEARLAAVRAGAEAYLVKPVDMEVLFEQLDRLTLHQGEEPYRILMVDDDAALSQHYALILRDAGMRVGVVNEPELLLADLADLDPEIILLDLYLPTCSGFELAQIIRQQDRYLGIPIVYLSTEQDQHKQFAAMRLGGDAFLTKPVADDYLVSSIAIRAARARKISALMSQDSLTGLLKHTRIKEQLTAEVSRAGRSGEQLVFIMLDIDGFKAINDQYGHLTGDRVIKTLAHMLSRRVRQSDSVGRYGGEEFAIIIPECGAGDAIQIMEEIRKDFAHIHHRHLDNSFTVTFSAGVVEYQKGDSAHDLIQLADNALYQAKSQGRNCICQAGDQTNVTAGGPE